MSFWIIFLCLVIGAMVGFEFGKTAENRRIREAMNSISEGMREAAEKIQKMSEKQKEQANHILDKLGIVGFDTRYYRVNDTVWEQHKGTLNKKKELELCSNLIVEMTRKGAIDSEIGRVVRYSLVVMDTEKLHLDWEKAKEDEGVGYLKDKYMSENQKEIKEEISDGERA